MKGFILAFFILLTFGELGHCYAVSSSFKGKLHVPSNAQSFADKQLKEILESQAKLVNVLKHNPAGLSEVERNRKIRQVLDSYGDFLKKNPEHLYGHILYGKFLKQVGLDDEAFRIFLKANKIDSYVHTVKQQLANHYSENGEFELALPLFLEAIDLNPKEPLYHYQLGEFLVAYKKELLIEKIYEKPEISRNILRAFRQASLLQPDDLTLKMRYAEAYFDIYEPDWSEALTYWEEIGRLGKLSEEQKDLVNMQKSRVLVALSKYREAKILLNGVFAAKFEKARRQLLEQISLLEEST